ncbi:MAG: SpoVA/SpoVAEb family sporulation membrane protein [Oscillospiraceae bacterium]|nr:SpoVA/SpoVAEb family sporulation membrane protein [Oscillospiraceae bacterium]
MTKSEYTKYAEKKAPKSKVWRDTLVAWASGGTVCVIGQILVNVFVRYGMPQKLAFTTASIVLIFIAALLTALHIYDSIAKWAGGGMLVPITGFSNAMTAPAMEFKSEGMVSGLAVKMFSIAGPVIVFGILASIVYGAVLLIFKAGQ